MYCMVVNSEGIFNRRQAHMQMIHARRRNDLYASIYYFDEGFLRLTFAVYIYN